MLEAQMHRNFWEFRNFTVKIFKLSPVCPTSTPMFGSQLHQTALKGISNACYDIFIDHFHSSKEKRSLKQWACSFYFASSLKPFSAFWTHSGSSSSLGSCGEESPVRPFTVSRASLHLLPLFTPSCMEVNANNLTNYALTGTEPPGETRQAEYYSWHLRQRCPAKGTKPLSACQWWGVKTADGLHNHASVQLRILCDLLAWSFRYLLLINHLKLQKWYWWHLGDKQENSCTNSCLMLFIIPGFSFLISLQTLRCVVFCFCFLLMSSSFVCVMWTQH